MTIGALQIGTSGWHYRHWKGVFYPETMRPEAWLKFYANHFTCVEINNTFYQFPAQVTIEHWLADTPPDFVFALKASRYITHMKKLRECEQALARFLEQSRLFGRKLGPILFQLPPHWRVNIERLETFLKALPEGLRFAMEFRDQSWHINEVYDLLASQGVAFCQFDLAGFESAHQITGDIVYVRLHGPAAAYCGSYSDAVLKSRAYELLQWKKAGKQIFVFFDNDEAGYAVQNARRLDELCGK